MFIIISFLSAFRQIRPRIRPLPIDARLEMEVRPGGAPGAAGEGDDVSRLHRLSHFCQQLGAVAVQRNESVAVVDAYVVAVASGIVLGDRHRSRQRGADGRAGGNGQIHAAVPLAFSGDGIDAITEFRGDTALPA